MSLQITAVYPTWYFLIWHCAYAKFPLSQHFLLSLQVQAAKLTLPTSPYYRLPVVACLLFYFLLIICFLFFLCVQLINLRRGIAACGTPSALCWSPITELGQGHYPSHMNVWTILLPLQYRHEAPSRHGAICRDPSSGGLSGRWFLSEPCWLFPAQFCLPKSCALCYFFVLSVHLNINAPYVKHIECLRWLQCCTWP